MARPRIKKKVVPIREEKAPRKKPSPPPAITVEIQQAIIQFEVTIKRAGEAAKRENVNATIMEQDFQSASISEMVSAVRQNVLNQISSGTPAKKAKGDS